MGLTIRGQHHPEIERGVDRSSNEAEKLARELHDNVGSDACTHAVVDRFDGLVLYFELPSGSVAQHFRCALAGYGGTGPSVSAAILELFGFGKKREIFESISRGGDEAYFSFVK